MNKISQQLVDSIKDTIAKDKKTTAAVFLSYMGGKSSLSSRLISFFPRHGTYVEPFCGSACIFFRKKKAQHSVLNDKNDNIINLFKQVRNNLDELINWCWFTPLSKKTFDQVKHVFDDKKYWNQISDLHKAVGYLYLHQNSFQNKTNNKFYPGVRNKWDRESLIYSLFWASDMFKDCIIENRDVQNLFNIDTYNNKTSFWYLDPPYHNTNSTDYYESNFKEEDHWNLSTNIHRLQGKWMISYDDSPTIREYYKNYHIHNTKPILYSSPFGEVQFKNEIVITNYDLLEYKKQMNLLQEEILI